MTETTTHMSFEDAMAHLRLLNHLAALAMGLDAEQAKAQFSKTLDAAHVMTARTLIDINPETVISPGDAQTLVGVVAAHYAMATGQDPTAMGRTLAAAGMIATADMLVRAT